MRGRGPAIVQAVRPIWRGPLPDVLAAHPELTRATRLGGTGAGGMSPLHASAATEWTPRGTLR